MWLSKKSLGGRAAEGWLGVWAGLLLVASVTGTAAAPIAGDWGARWEEDLRFAQAEAEKRHPNLFHTLERDAWNLEFDELIARLSTIEHHQATVELARIVARLHDGHSRLTLPLGPGIDFEQGHSATAEPKLESLRFHQYPVRFMLDSRGLHIRRIAARHRQGLGGRVVKLGQLATEEAIAAVSPTIRRDNAMQIKEHLPMHLSLAEVLHARGVTRDLGRLPLEIESSDGKTLALTLAAVGFDETVEWRDARDGAPGELPLYLRHPERNFWFEHLPEIEAVYLQYNQVNNDPDESVRAFSARLERFLRENHVANVIVDVRANRGGNGALNLPLLHALIRSEANRTGHLFVLAGRTTFSAAMMFAIDLERHTHALFSGEATGSSPNQYGDSRKILLPNTGLTLRISTLYWQHDPTDPRETIAPLVPVELTMADYLANRDPVFDAVRAIIVARRAERGTLVGSWEGRLSPGLNDIEMALDIGPGPRASVRVPAMELDAEAAEVEVEGREIRFQLTWRDEPVRFVGSVAGEWLIGEGEYRTVAFPFAVRRRAR